MPFQKADKMAYLEMIRMTCGFGNLTSEKWIFSSSRGAKAKKTKIY
jgi:hypothetical protein